MLDGKWAIVWSTDILEQVDETSSTSRSPARERESRGASDSDSDAVTPRFSDKSGANPCSVQKATLKVAYGPPDRQRSTAVIFDSWRVLVAGEFKLSQTLMMPVEGSSFV